MARKKITFSSENEKNNIYINSYGNLVFDTAKNSLPFSLALNYNDTGYFLEVFDDSANTIGKINL